MSVELDSLGSDGSGEVEGATRADHALELLETTQMPDGIECVTIAAKSKVLDGVEAGKRIGEVDPLRVECLHEVDLVKLDIRHGHGLRADVEYFNFSKDREGSDETIEPRTDIDVPQRFGVMDPLGNDLILIKVSSQCSAAFVPLGDHCQLLAPRHELGSIHSTKRRAITQVARPIPQCSEDPARADAGIAEETVKFQGSSGQFEEEEDGFTAKTRRSLRDAEGGMGKS